MLYYIYRPKSEFKIGVSYSAISLRSSFLKIEYITDLFIWPKLPKVYIKNKSYRVSLVQSNYLKYIWQIKQKESSGFNQII